MTQEEKEFIIDAVDARVAHYEKMYNRFLNDGFSDYGRGRMDEACHIADLLFDLLGVE